jgi:hypothetical protein
VTPLPVPNSVVSFAEAPTMSTGLPGASTAGPSVNDPAPSLIVSFAGPLDAAEASAAFRSGWTDPTHPEGLWTQKVSAEAVARGDRSHGERGARGRHESTPVCSDGEHGETIVPAVASPQGTRRRPGGGDPPRHWRQPDICALGGTRWPLGIRSRWLAGSGGVLGLRLGLRAPCLRRG